MGLYLLIPTLIVIIASVLIVRAGAIALRMTGLDDTTARFQALSAFTRSGFTTRESEQVVNNPQRRAIISWLIILGNAGIVAVIVTATSSLTTSTNYKLVIDIGVLFAGLYLVYVLARHTGMTRKWENLVENRFMRASYFNKDPQVEHLLHFVDGYGVGRIKIMGNSPITNNMIKNNVKLNGFNILGIERLGQWIANPGPDKSINDNDYLILYGVLSEMEKFTAAAAVDKANHLEK